MPPRQPQFILTNHVNYLYDKVWDGRCVRMTAMMRGPEVLVFKRICDFYRIPSYSRYEPR